MRRRAAQIGLLGVLLAVAMRGDDVYLKNGAVFEGVVAELGATQVRIQLTYGEMTLPLSHVQRVEKSESALESFFGRRARLKSGDSTPQDWLELARWARLNNLYNGYREATLVTAELAPHLEELAPMMRALGYALDDELERWIPHGEAMLRRGYVLHQGEWMLPRERERQLAERRLEEPPPAPVRLPPAPEPGPSGNEMALAQLELFRDVLDTVQRGFPGFLVLGHGSFFGHPPPGFDAQSAGIHPVASSSGTLGFTARAGGSPWDLFLHRQPGSLIPLGR